MKNTLLTFDKEEVDINNGTLFVSDYFTLNHNIRDIVLEDTEPDFAKYLRIVEVPDGMTYEGISYMLYNTSNYWDLIVLLNDDDPLSGLPRCYDVIVASAEREIETIDKRIKESNGLGLNPEAKADLLQRTITKNFNENELKRMVIVPAKESLHYLLINLKRRDYL